MRFEYEGMSLWYGTPDAPAPEGTVQTGTELTVTVGVQPWNAGNNVEVLYQINQGPIEHISAKWLRNDSHKKSQYFRAHFPTLRVGDTVEYIALCRRAGRQVVPPPSTQTEHFASSFYVIGVGAKQELGSAPDLRAMAIDQHGMIRPNLPPRNGGNGGGGGDNGNGSPHPHPPPPINFPEIGFQFAGCLDQYNNYLVPPPNEPPNTRAWFQDILRQAVAQSVGGNPQVSSGCGANGEVGGVWLASNVDERGLNFIQILPAGEAYAFEFFETPLRGIVDRVWRIIQPAYSNDQFTLTDYEFNLVPPNQLVLKFHGTAHPPSLPDTPATVTFTTIFFTSVYGKVVVNTVFDIDVNTDLFIALIWPVIAGGALGGAPSAAEFAWFVQNLVNDKVEESKEMRGNSLAGLARMIRQKLLAAFPNRFLIPGAATTSYQPHKLEFFYDKNPQVGLNGGILATSSQSFPDLYQIRQPSLNLGDQVVTWSPNNPDVSDPRYPGYVKYGFNCSPFDLREPLQVNWAATGDVPAIVLSPTTQGTDILFGPVDINFLTGYTPGSYSETISVDVTDVDGLRASKSIQVTIIYGDAPQPPPPEPIQS